MESRSQHQLQAALLELEVLATARRMCARPVAVRALVFDVFGTWSTGAPVFRRSFAASGLSADFEELADAWRARFWPAIAEVTEGPRAWPTSTSFTSRR